MPLRRVALAAAVWAAGLGLTVALPREARALTGAGAVAALNAQRAANGIPGDLVERTDWTAACAAHDRYMQLNTTLDATEDPAKRGYSKQGAWAAQNSALARDTWTADHNPWQNAPIHLMQLLSPRLAMLGASTAYSHACATTFPGYLRPPPSQPSLYTYPGDGVVGVRFSQWSFELPFTPGDFVGVPAGFTTGPILFVMADVPGQARIADASLVGPEGPVDIRTVDNTVDTLGPYLPTGAMIIPVSALDPGGSYTASATVTIGDLMLTRHWGFTTDRADPYTLLFVVPSLSVDASKQPPVVTQGNISVKTQSPAPVHVTMVRDGQELGSHDLVSGDNWTPPQIPGTFRVCGHQEPTSYYRGFDGCSRLRIRDAASFSHPTTIAVTAAIAGRVLRYKLTVSPPAGRKATLSARRLVKGSWHTFRTVVRDANRVLTRTITARATDTAVQVQVSVPTVRIGAEVYRSATLTKTIRR